ncbi:MAG: DNA helicase UvrBC, partial [Phycisphaeraceae bacterium]|nr:DNA helicase UvrBC [Phycisphaeraceae bacterium]
MKHDLTGLMREWPFEGDRLQARIVSLAEDREVLQVRVELG